MLNKNGCLESCLVVLDVGHGNCAVLLDEDSTLVIDTGPKSTLMDFLDTQKITDINTVLVSHADMDHIGGLLGLVSSAEYNIGQVYLNTDSLKDTDIWDDLLYELLAQNVPYFASLTSQQSGIFDTKNVGVEIVAPSSYLALKGPGSVDRSGRKITSNSVSAVIRLHHNNSPFALIPGDLDIVGLANLVELNSDIRSPIVVFPHHGGLPGSRAHLESFAKEFLSLVAPSTVIFSNGRGSHGNPRKQVVEEAKSLGTWVFCTQLSQNCAPDAPQPDAYGHLNKQIIGRGNASCSSCGGTFVFCYSTGSTWPQRKAHSSFVQTHANSALCEG